MKKFKFFAVLAGIAVSLALAGCDLLSKIDTGSLLGETVIVTFDSDGGSKVAPQTIKKGSGVKKPEDPTKEGFVFEAWYNGSAEWDFEKIVNENMILKAKWREPASEEERNPTKWEKPVVEELPDGSTVTTVQGEKADGTKVEVETTTDKNGNTVTTEKSDFTTGVSVTTKVDEKGNVTADAEDKDGNAIELVELEIPYNEWGPNYQTGVSLLDYLPNEEEIVKGDVVKIEFTGVALTDLENFAYNIIATGKADGFWQVLNKDCERAWFKGYYGAQKAGAAVNFSTEIEILEQPVDLDMSKIHLVFVSEFLSNENIENHKDSISVLGNLTVSLDKTKRQKKVTVTLDGKTYQRYPGQAIIDEPELEKGWFFNGYKDDAGNKYKATPAKTCNLTSDISQEKLLYSSVIEGNVKTDEIKENCWGYDIPRDLLEDNRDAYIYIVDNCKNSDQWLVIYPENYNYNYSNDKNDVIFHSNDYGKSTVFNYAFPVKYLLAEADKKEAAFGHDYGYIRVAEWGGLGCEKIILTYDLANVKVNSWKSAEYDYEALVPCGYPLPTNGFDGIEIYKDSAYTKKVSEIPSGTKELECYMKMPAPVVSASGRMKVGYDPDIDGFVITLKHLSEDDKNVTWCTMDLFEESGNTCLKMLNGWCGENEPLEKTFVFPFVETGKTYQFRLVYQSSKVDWCQESVSITSTISGVPVEAIVNVSDEIGKTKILCADDSYTMKLNKDVRRFFTDIALQKCSPKIDFEVIAGNTYWEGNTEGVYKTYVDLDETDKIELLLDGLNLEEAMYYDEWKSKFSKNPTWFVRGNVIFRLPLPGCENSTFALNLEFSPEYGSESKSHLYKK